MQLRQTALLALTALSAVLLYAVLGGPPLVPGISGPAYLFPGLEPEGVLAITIERPREGGPAVRLERATDDESFRLVAPVEDAADPDVVGPLVEAIARAERLEQLRAFDPAAVGLAPPRLVVRFERVDGRRPVLEVGEADLTGRRVHVRVRGEAQVALVDRHIVERLDVPVIGLRQKDLVSLDPWRVERLLLKGPHSELAFAKEGGFWRMERPEAGYADPSRIEALLRALDATRVKRFIDEPARDLARYDLDPALAIVTLEGQTQQQTLLLGGRAERDGELFAKRASEPSVLVVEDRVTELIKWAPEPWRSQQLLHVQEASIHSLAVERTGEVVARLERGPRGWAFTTPKGAPASQEAVEEAIASLLLARVAAVAAEEPRDLGNFGLAEPFILEVGTRAKPVRLEIGGRSQRRGGRYVRREGDKQVLDAVLPIADELVEAYPVLRDRRLLSIPPADVARLLVARGDEAPVPFVRNPAGGFATPGAEVDPEAVSRAIAAIAGLTARRIIPTPADPAAVGLDRPWLVLTASAAPATPGAEVSSVRLALGRRSDAGEQIAQLETAQGRALYLTLAQEVVEALDAKLVVGPGR